ncbi:hypothetical protein CPB83DRAFT_423621 [Crepidotus variabilis]|uniref:Uncharacterized protein n=1 Tax=Crepidotus variabilis TaxID=179855 RepID=A0A9P6ED07_9AGAR|nr:hypothetical protein CPB83DRAFT_423621 [Crepidotus variabilis]
MSCVFPTTNHAICKVCAMLNLRPPFYNLHACFTNLLLRTFHMLLTYALTYDSVPVMGLTLYTVRVLAFGYSNTLHPCLFIVVALFVMNPFHDLLLSHFYPYFIALTATLLEHSALFCWIPGTYDQKYIYTSGSVQVLDLCFVK